MFRRLSLLLLVSLATVASAQDIISARAGFVNYKHGQVSLPAGRDGKDLRQLESGQTVFTRNGRLEVLLTPGSFLRLDNESAARLISSRLTDVQLELLRGTATIEVNEIPKGSAVTLIWRDQKVPIAQRGLYRFEPGPDSMRVYVESGKLTLGRQTLKAGKYVDLTPEGTLAAALKFNRKNMDEFDRWNAGRGYQLATSSFRAANSFGQWPSTYPRSSLWYWDPFGYCYTYMPYRASILSPWGFYYHSPRTVYSSPSHSGGGYSAGSAGSGSAGGSASAGSSGGGSGAYSGGSAGASGAVSGGNSGEARGGGGGAGRPSIK